METSLLLFSNPTSDLPCAKCCVILGDPFFAQETFTPREITTKYGKHPLQGIIDFILKIRLIYSTVNKFECVYFRNGAPGVTFITRHILQPIIDTIAMAARSSILLDRTMQRK
jgi:hypothetical protein